MKLRTRSLRANLLIYFLIFSAIILSFLFFFQILFLNTYYKIDQSNMLSSAINDIEKNYSNDNIIEYLNNISLNNELCIQVVSEGNVIYSSNYYKHCSSKNNVALVAIQNEFMSSDKNSMKVEFINNVYHNKSLVYGKKINDNVYIFANASLEPIDKSINLLKSQFLYVVLIVLLLSFIISYFFSKRLADPIVKISNSANKISKKDYDVIFNSDTEVYELKELADTLNHAVKELKVSEELRREFLANISHDLKTPLTMIEAYASSAKDLNYNNKKKRERDLNVIIDEAERLNSLVNDILVLTKIQSNAVELKMETFDITALINDIIKRFAIYENDGYSFVFDSSISYFIVADKKNIERVIYNLIANAINYTGEDKKIIILLEKNDDILTVNVKDTGLGISEEDIDLVWNKYFKTNKRHKRENIGTGLGLSIVKEVLEKHGFEYGVNSSKNQGTTFFFKCKIKE